MNSTETVMAGPAARLSLRWLPGVLCMLVILALLHETAWSMVQIWWQSETFTHAFLVPFIALWLGWRRRAALAAAPAAGMPVLLLPMALVAFAWLLGQLAAVAAVSQFALVALLVLSVPLLYGAAVTRLLAFPLGFLFFAVPFGEFTQPVMMEWTANFTVAALRATGIPVYREGLQFVIPTGSWSVVEACSGVRYLIASFMVGTLFAYLNYQSLRRRLAFVAVSLLVPILANWLRAYLIVMVGHLSGNELATGADHLVYGWVFFGIVIGLMFFIGMRWAEGDLPASHSLEASASRNAGSQRAPWALWVGAIALVCAVQAWMWRLDHQPARGVPQLVLPATPAAGSAVTPPAALPWVPGFLHANTVAQARFQQGERPLWVWVGYYRQQNVERKLVTSIHTWAATGQDWSVSREGAQPAAADLPSMRTATLRQGSALGANSGQRVRVWRLYWVGGSWTASDARAKVYQALNRLVGRGDDGAVVLMATPEDDAADTRLGVFARGWLPALDGALAGARQSP